jgi:hypothetical protein
MTASFAAHSRLEKRKNTSVEEISTLVKYSTNLSIRRNMNTHFYCSQVTYAASLGYYELELNPLFRLEDTAIRSVGWCFKPGSNVASGPLQHR